MKQEIKIGRNKAKLVFVEGVETDNSKFENGHYQITFKNKEQVNRFYDYVKNNCEIIETFFEGNPYKTKSSITFEDKDGLNNLTLFAPKAKNGDNNWYSYNEDFGYYSEIVTSTINN